MFCMVWHSLSPDAVFLGEGYKKARLIIMENQPGIFFKKKPDFKFFIVK